LGPNNNLEITAYKLPQSWNRLEARVGKELLAGYHDGKVLRKIRRDRQGKNHKEVCLHGEGGGSGEDLVGLEADLEANRTCTGEQEVQREGLVRR
jgi:hypothetical protein